MNVATVTTTDRSLLSAVRSTLLQAEDALLCVAFVQERGLHLIRDEVRQLEAARRKARLLVTTALGQSPEPALALARQFGFAVRVLNPSAGSTFHPKLYLGRSGDRVRAVVGSANLTGGLATNVEVAVALDGVCDDKPLALAWDWAESLWGHPRAAEWQPTPGASDLGREVILPDLFKMMKAELSRTSSFQTLGRAPVANRVTDMTEASVYVETRRSRALRIGSQEIPAWMFNIAWDYLRTHGRLTNTLLLNELRVHRSSAVCAILAHLPGVRVSFRAPIELEWFSPQ